MLDRLKAVAAARAQVGAREVEQLPHPFAPRRLTLKERLVGELDDDADPRLEE